MQLAAQSALIGVSVADLYPSIALLGSLGISATSLSGAVRRSTGRSARAWSGTSSTTAG
jgi:outer membrane protein TolC